MNSSTQKSKCTTLKVGNVYNLDHFRIGFTSGSQDNQFIISAVSFYSFISDIWHVYECASLSVHVGLGTRLAPLSRWCTALIGSQTPSLFLPMLLPPLNHYELCATSLILFLRERRPSGGNASIMHRPSSLLQTFPVMYYLCFMGKLLYERYEI